MKENKRNSNVLHESKDVKKTLKVTAAVAASVSTAALIQPVLTYASEEEIVIQQESNSSDYQTTLDNYTQQIEQAKADHSNASDAATDAMEALGEAQANHNSLINQIWDEDAKYQNQQKDLLDQAEEMNKVLNQEVEQAKDNLDSANNDSDNLNTELKDAEADLDTAKKEFSDADFDKNKFDLSHSDLYTE